MQHQTYHPATNVETIRAFKEIQYLQGAPRTYRFHAKAGNFNFRGETQLTARGESFTFKPIAYRFFACDLFSGESIARG